MDFLIWLRRTLQPVVDRLHVRPLAQRCYRRILALRYGPDDLATVRQNDRTWKYALTFALQGEQSEYDTILWFRRAVRPGDCVIDVGANVGQMTLEAAHLVGPTGKVLAVEPGPGNLALLRRHVGANGFADRVEIIPAACTAADGGEVELSLVGASPDVINSGHTIRTTALDGRGYAAAVRVPAVSVDGLCRERGARPVAIKIDVEGAELEVLKGCEQTLRACRPSVWFAFHPFAFGDPAAATRDIRALFERCGYTTPEPGPGGAYELLEYEAKAAAGRPAD
jgi:FkbM family methyltransferase